MHIPLSNGGGPLHPNRAESEQDFRAGRWTPYPGNHHSQTISHGARSGAHGQYVPMIVQLVPH